MRGSSFQKSANTCGTGQAAPAGDPDNARMVDRADPFVGEGTDAEAVGAAPQDAPDSDADIGTARPRGPRIERTKAVPRQQHRDAGLRIVGAEDGAGSVGEASHLSG